MDNGKGIMDNSYKKLDAYIMAKELVRMVYDATKRFPDEEKFVLCNQIRRAAISVPSNIAEGLSRSAIKEQCHFLDIAFGSLMETDCQFEIANKIIDAFQNDFVETKYFKSNIYDKALAQRKELEQLIKD